MEAPCNHAPRRSPTVKAGLAVFEKRVGPFLLTVRGEQERGRDMLEVETGLLVESSVDGLLGEFEADRGVVRDFAGETFEVLVELVDIVG